ncbi:hypothetical protein OIDMADRAFT_30267 [Oidiodendron maius Zn]|uniref:Uncharacterized protein n=1 Tax=Oidiodendron maius (strain Zn) TaxID=913774 RepID=A0A0C3H9F1_OIDMZ|nr:hypothetical protein OIDMADRAFT_30267 [Oidiodendron maius Zn]
MYMSTPREDIDKQYVEDAVYIPTNDRNLVSLVIARRLELDITASNTFVLCWQTPSHSFGSDIYKMEFGVRSDLPCSVILGKLDPSVFLGATGELFDESFEFLKSRPNSVSNPVSRAVKSPASGSGPTTAKNKTAKMPPPAKPTKLANRTNTTSTWASDQTRVVRAFRMPTWGSDETKVNTQPSSPQRLSPIKSSPSSSPPWTPIAPKAIHSAIAVPAVKRDVEAQNEDNRQNNRNRQSVVESTARLGPAPCEVAEDAREEIRGPPFGDSSTEHSNLQREKEPTSASSHYESRHLNSSNSQIPVVQQQNELVLNANVRSNNSKSPASYAAKYDHIISPDSVEAAKFSRSHGADISPVVWNDLNPAFDREILSTTEGRNSGLGMQSHSRSAELDALKDRSPRYENKTRTASEPSIKSPENSLYTMFSAGQESPTSHGNITSYSVKRFLQPGPNSAQDHKTAELVKTSDSSMDEQEPRSKKRSQKRGKVPRIRRAKLDASHNVDLTPAPGAEEYWTYDPGARAYYHTDSDTHSRIWKSESDSEDSG